LTGGLAWIRKGTKEVSILTHTEFRRLDLWFEPEDLGESAGLFWFSSSTGSFCVLRTEDLAFSRSGAPVNMRIIQIPKDVRHEAGSVILLKGQLWVQAEDGKTLLGRAFQDKPAQVHARQPAVHGIETHGGELRNLMAGPDGERLFTTDQGYGYADATATQAKGKGKVDTVPLGGEPQRLIQTRSGYLCTLIEKLGFIGCFNRFTEENRLRGPFQKDRLKPGDLAEGPGGVLWFTEPANNAVASLDLTTGASCRYPMPQPGLEPTFIVNGGDGRMYFSPGHGPHRQTPLLGGLQLRREIHPGQQHRRGGEEAGGRGPHPQGPALRA
jgi:hypothetical protein